MLFILVGHKNHSADCYVWIVIVTCEYLSHDFYRVKVCNLSIYYFFSYHMRTTHLYLVNWFKKKIVSV